MTIDDHGRSGAPGALEDVRVLLNSWHVPNDTRAERDELADWAREDRTWGERFHTLPRPAGPRDIDGLARVRDAVRALVDGDAAGFEEISSGEHRPGIGLADGALRFVPGSSAAGLVVATVLTAAVDGTLSRLRTCADCGWAFYDSSRNSRRRWCAMVPAPGVRGCGSAAKARDYRNRHRPDPVSDA